MTFLSRIFGEKRDRERLQPLYAALLAEARHPPWQVARRRCASADGSPPAIAAAKCGGVDQLLSSNYVPCPWDPPPVGSGGSSGGGSGGWRGGSGGSSSGGTSSGGSSGSSGGGCSSCVLDEGYEGGGAGCTASNTCGFTADYLQGKCIPLPDEGVLDENGYTPGPEYPQDPGDPTDPNDPGYDPDAEDYVDPQEVEESRGGVTAGESGCSVAGGQSRSAAWLAGLLGIALLARRRRS